MLLNKSFKLMPCRWEQLQETWAGFQDLHISLVGKAGEQIKPFHVGDDVGLYIAVPRIAQFFHLSLKTATHIFLISLYLLPFIIGLSVFLYYYKHKLQRTCAIFYYTVILWIIYSIGDLYAAYAALPLIIIPIALYLYERNRLMQSYFFYALTGFFASCLHYVRAYASLPSLVFLCALSLFERNKKSWHTTLFCFFMGASIPVIYVHTTLKQYRTFMQDYSNKEELIINQHPFWHTIYLGLGFLNNNPGHITFSDGHAVSMVKEHVCTKTYSDEYENTLKTATLNFIKKYPEFFLITIFAKLGVLLYFFLKYAHIGIIAAYIRPKPYAIDIAFACSLMSASIFPLIGLSWIKEYALGFIIITILWSLVSINYWLARKNS